MKPRAADTRSDYWLLMLFALLILGLGFDLPDPWPAGQPRFALIAKNNAIHRLTPSR